MTVPLQIHYHFFTFVNVQFHLIFLWPRFDGWDLTFNITAGTSWYSLRDSRVVHLLPGECVDLEVVNHQLGHPGEDRAPPPTDSLLIVWLAVFGHLVVFFRGWSVHHSFCPQIFGFENLRYIHTYSISGVSIEADNRQILPATSQIIATAYFPMEQNVFLPRYSQHSHLL